MINADRLESAYLSLPVGIRRLIPDGWRTALRNHLLPEWRTPLARSNTAWTMRPTP